MSESSKVTGWNTLWPWVIVAFLIVIGAWVWLIRTASDHAPEPIPLESEADRG
jgi:hypothetical protein